MKRIKINSKRIIRICSLVLAILASMSFLAWATVRIDKAVQFEINCTQYLERAACASTVDTAKEELAKAISYAEEKRLTEGVVSIFLRQPQNDIGFWYKNLKEAYDVLELIPENASALEKTNALMKLRESLGDETKSGFSISVPEGIEIHPYNAIFFWWSMISLFGALLFWGMFALIDDEEESYYYGSYWDR